MSGGGKIPTNVMTLKEWVENTDLDEVGKYVKSKLKKPETQIYVIGEEDDYAVTIDTDWKEDKPLTDEEGSEHTLYIGKGVVEVDTDGAFTNTFFTKDANSTITKKYDEMSGGGKTKDSFTYDEGPGESDIMDMLEKKITYKGKMGYVDSESSWLGNSDDMEDAFHKWFHHNTPNMKTLKQSEVDTAEYDAENGFIYVDDYGFVSMAFPVDKLPKSFNAKPMKY
jgi:hypothetical protein